MHDPGPGPTLAPRVFAWGGAAAFAVSLAYFLYTYIVTFSETASPSNAPWRAVAMDVGLFGLFAAHHSAFARTRLRHWVAGLVSPDLERSVFVWVASLLLFAVCVLWVPLPGVAWEMTGAWRWIMGVPLLIGIWLTLRSAGIIDVWELAGIRQLSTADYRLPTPGRSQVPMPSGATEFKTSGPYGLVRHPIYLGWILVVFSVPTMTMTRLVFAVVSCLYLVVAIPFEERTIIATAGDGYRDYMRRVRSRLVPGVW